MQGFGAYPMAMGIRDNCTIISHRVETMPQKEVSVVPRMSYRNQWKPADTFALGSSSELSAHGDHSCLVALALTFHASAYMTFPGET